MQLRLPLLLLLLAGLPAGGALLAQEAATGGPEITVHGYLSQAYAQSNGHQFLGITRDGTADYRTAALQLRADLGEEDAFVVQLSEERLGASRLNEVKGDVELDWLFYQHRWGDSSVKVGRVQIPFGIYNEVLDAGTVLPFYRPSHNFYGEGAYSVETIDGIVLSHAFRPGEGWGLNADLLYGEAEITERTLAGEYVKGGVHNAIGAELWLDTPVSGLRFGTGAMYYEVDSITPGFKAVSTYHVSVVQESERFAVHAEAKRTDLGAFGTSVVGYVHLGIDLTGRLTLNLHEELSSFDVPHSGWRKIDSSSILGVNFAFKPALVLKAEHHWNESGYWLEDLPLTTPDLFPVRFWILSLSTSF